MVHSLRNRPVGNCGSHCGAIRHDSSERPISAGIHLNTRVLVRTLRSVWSAPMNTVAPIDPRRATSRRFLGFCPRAQLCRKDTAAKGAYAARACRRMRWTARKPSAAWIGRLTALRMNKEERFIADRITRRGFLGATATASLAALSGGAPTQLRADAPQATADAAIVLWMAGGMAQTETFDPKRYTPFAPGVRTERVLSTFPAIDTSGMALSSQPNRPQ